MIHFALLRPVAVRPEYNESGEEVKGPVLQPGFSFTLDELEPGYLPVHDGQWEVSVFELLKGSAQAPCPYFEKEQGEEGPAYFQCGQDDDADLRICLGDLSRCPLKKQG